MNSAFYEFIIIDSLHFFYAQSGYKEKEHVRHNFQSARLPERVPGIDS